MNKAVKDGGARRFNVLDAFIILIVAALLGGGLYAYDKYTEGLNQNKQAIEYKVELKGVDQSFVDAIAVGDPLRESVKGNNLGVVKERIYTPASNINTDYLNGKYVAVDIPNKLDVILTISSVADVTDRRIVTGGLEIRIGQKLFVKGKGYAKEGFILNIDTKE